MTTASVTTGGEKAATESVRAVSGVGVRTADQVQDTKALGDRVGSTTTRVSATTGAARDAAGWAWAVSDATRTPKGRSDGAVVAGVRVAAVATRAVEGAGKP